MSAKDEAAALTEGDEVWAGQEGRDESDNAPPLGDAEGVAGSTAALSCAKEEEGEGDEGMHVSACAVMAVSHRAGRTCVACSLSE